MPIHYSTEFRRQACERMLSGESVKALAVELSITEATLFRWKKQCLIDRELLPGAKSFETDELARARRTIKELEAELELVKAASALFNGEELVRPKGSTRLPRHWAIWATPNPPPGGRLIFVGRPFTTESALIAASLWDSVRDRLKAGASTLSGGEQQRLCIARALAVEPEVLLMDEPTFVLDPQATRHIENLIGELKDRVTIVIVTHNMQQAARISDRCVFLLMADDRAGELVEVGPTSQIFESPKDPRTADYVNGRFG
jgi:transposase-like protein